MSLEIGDLKFPESATVIGMFKEHPEVCWTIVALTLLDILTTMTFLSLGQPEGNPLFVVAFAHGLHVPVFVLKIAFTLVAIYFAYILSKSTFMIGATNVAMKAGQMCFVSPIPLLSFIVAINTLVIFDCLIGGPLCM